MGQKIKENQFHPRPGESDFSSAQVRLEAHAVLMNKNPIRTTRIVCDLIDKQVSKKKKRDQEREGERVKECFVVDRASDAREGTRTFNLLRAARQSNIFSFSFLPGHTYTLIWVQWPQQLEWQER